MNLFYFSMIMLPACFHLSSKNRHSYLGLVWTWWNNLPNYCCGHGKKCANSGENLAVFYNLSPHVAACRSNKIVTNRAYNSTLLMLCIYSDANRFIKIKNQLIVIFIIYCVKCILWISASPWSSLFTISVSVASCEVIVSSLSCTMLQ